MGYTFTVGNAVPKFDKEDFPYLSARWEVEGMELPDAPEFPEDQMTGKSNSRSPSYITWAEFCRDVGLYDAFYDERGHLHAGHPGCSGIDEEFAARVSAARVRMEKRATLPPGFSGWGWREGDPILFDANLARVLWLDWWVQWALKNCETPAIENT